MTVKSPTPFQIVKETVKTDSLELRAANTRASVYEPVFGALKSLKVNESTVLKIPQGVDAKVATNRLISAMKRAQEIKRIAPPVGTYFQRRSDLSGNIVISVVKDDGKPRRGKKTGK